VVGTILGPGRKFSGGGLNTTWVYEYTEKLGVIGYRIEDYLLTVN
jgi:hypothetical protein